MNKLLFFASDYSIGLSSLLTDQLLASYSVGIDVCAIAGEKEQEPGLYQIIKSAGVSIICIPGLDEHRNFIHLAAKIVSVIKEQNIDIIHVQNNWQLALVTFVKLKLMFEKRKLKVVYTLHAFRHNNHLKSILAQLIIGTALFLFVDKIICMCNYLKTKFRLLSYKIVILPLGITDSFFTEEHVPLPTVGLQMVFPAQFRKGKNQDMLIAAFAKYVNETNDSLSRLVLPGDGPLLNKMKELVRLLQIEVQVIFPGQCTKEEIKRWYLKSNIGIVASNCETFGQSIVEPYVLGRCVITTHVGVAGDIIKNRINGFFFSDEETLISVLKTMYTTPSLVNEIGQRNYNARNQFKWNNIARQYKKKIIL